MAAATIDELAMLLRETLLVWRLCGEVRLEAGEISISAGGRALRIVAAPGDAPFDWFVQTPEKSRGAASVTALLRAVRNTLDPENAGSRLRLAPQAILPP